MTLLSLWAGVALAAFLLGCAYKAVRYAAMPMHLRWELYPVAHEKGKAGYGGSYFEELDWWTKPQAVSRVGEVRVIAEEVLTLKAVRENNRPLWLPSLLFHYGLYLLFGLGVALVAGAAARVASIDGLDFLTGGRLLSVWGAVGLGLGTVGCAALLLRRLRDNRLRNASTPADFVHLWLLLGVFVASWGAWIVADRQYRATSAALAALGEGHLASVTSVWIGAELLLLGLFLAYLPWSHMTHMFTKFFTWHSVRWEDTPNLPGRGIDRKAERLLMLPVSWSAPHIKGDGRKNWVDVVKEGGEV
jgi:nitrate reductase gamma subunit